MGSTPLIRSRNSFLQILYFMLKALKMLAGHTLAFLLLVIGSIFGFGAVLPVWDQGGMSHLLNLGAGKLSSFSIMLSIGMAGIGLGVGLLSYLWTVVWPAEERTVSELIGADEPPEADTLRRLREGFMLDYEVRTWTVTEHKRYPYEGWPADAWTLEHDGEKRVLEYDREDGGTFQLYEKVPVSVVTVAGDPFREAMGADTVETGAPPHVECEETGDTTYTLAEEDVRVHDRARTHSGEEDRINFLTQSRTHELIKGVCGGIAQYLNVPVWLVRLVFIILGLAGGFGVIFFMAYLGGLNVPKPPPERLSHYWIYMNEEGELLTLQYVQGNWTAHAGREVASYEFDNILPRSGG